jgi:hypothetical protein
MIGKMRNVCRIARVRVTGLNCGHLGAFTGDGLVVSTFSPPVGCPARVRSKGLPMPDYRKRSNTLSSMEERISKRSSG